MEEEISTEWIRIEERCHQSPEMKLFKDYGKFVHSGIHLVWVLLIVVGACSTYFHVRFDIDF